MCRAMVQVGVEPGRVDDLARAPHARCPVGESVAELADDVADIAVDELGAVGLAAVEQELHGGRLPRGEVAREVLADMDDHHRPPPVDRGLYRTQARVAARLGKCGARSKRLTSCSEAMPQSWLSTPIGTLLTSCVAAKAKRNSCRIGGTTSAMRGLGVAEDGQQLLDDQRGGVMARLDRWRGLSPAAARVGAVSAEQTTLTKRQRASRSGTRTAPARRRPGRWSGARRRSSAAAAIAAGARIGAGMLSISKMKPEKLEGRQEARPAWRPGWRRTGSAPGRDQETQAQRHARKPAERPTRAEDRAAERHAEHEQRRADTRSPSRASRARNKGRACRRGTRRAGPAWRAGPPSCRAPTPAPRRGR